MSVQDIISIITALLMTSSSVSGPVYVSAHEESINAIPVEQVEIVMDKLRTTTDLLAAAGAAAMISGAESTVTEAMADMAESITSSISGLTDQEEVIEVQNDESLWYIPQIPMKKEHQKLLYECCIERGLDYIDMLALIALESNFQEKCSSGKFKGYFQISADHGPRLAKLLSTENKPLDGEVNIKWGTAFYSWILQDDRVKGLEGKQQRDVALSIYQRGTGGYDKYGINKKYLEKYYKKRDMIVSYIQN